jgi:hypothetical protein
MSRTLPGLVLAVIAGLGGSWSAYGQSPAAPVLPPPATPAAEPPPPIVDLTPVSLPERGNCNSPIECVTCCDRPPAFITYAEYLVVRPRRRANDYAIIDPVNNLSPQGEILNVPYDVSSAIRVGAGYRPAGSAWEFVVTYLYLHSGEERAAAAPPGGLLYATLTRPGIVDNVLVAAATSSMTMNVVDFESRRHFQIDNCFLFRLGMGVRFADVDQTLQGFYGGGDANAAAVRSRVSFDGQGLTLGAQGEWQFWREFRLFGRGRGSILMADFTNTLVETNNGGATVNANVVESYLQTVPILELASGIAWERRNVRVALGYEIQNWFNVIDSPTFVDDFAEGKLSRRKSDLGIEGLFLQLGLAF